MKPTGPSRRAIFGRWAAALSCLRLAYRGVREFSDRLLAKELNESDYFGKQVAKKKNQKALLEALEPAWAKAGAESKEEKALLAYEFLNQTIEWSGEYTITTDQDLADCLEKKKAHSGELNLMMLCVFNALEIESYPVLLSTRDHGKMLDLYPILSQFNHVVAVANMDGQMQLFDLGSPARPPGYLRVNSLNDIGWMVSETNPQWLRLAPPGTSVMNMYNMEIDGEGNATVSVRAKYEGYDAISLREDLEEDGEGKFLIKSWQEYYPDAQFNSLAFVKEEGATAPVKINYEEKLPGMAQAVGDFLYISPTLMPAFRENPFKLEARTYPVEIPYPVKVQDILFLKVPDDYRVEDLPESGRVFLPNDGGHFDYLFSNNGDKVQVIYKIEINQLNFQPEEYSVIKNFFNFILEKQGEQIVFQKK